MTSELGIFTTDENLVVRTWDDWLEQVTARSASDVCGKPLSELFPTLELRGLTATFRRVLEQGAVELLAPAFHGYLIECPPHTPSSLFKYMQQRTVIAPLREEMKITGLVVTIEDVTARREREIELESALSAENWQLRRRTLEELVAQSERAPVEELLKRLRTEHRDPSVLNAILQLLVSGAWEAFEPLLNLLKDDDNELRMYAALGLGDLKDRRAVPELVKLLLSDPDVNVKYHAIEALAKLNAFEAVDELLGIVQSGEFFLAFAALDALATIGDSRVAPDLVPILQNEMLRGAAAAALAKLGDASTVRPIVLLFRHQAIVPAIAEGLATLHDRYETLYGEGGHIADLVRDHAPAAAAENLLKVLNSLDGNSLRAVVRVLGWVGNNNVGHRLTHLLGSAEVRGDVVEALVRHGGRVLEPLCRQLEAADSSTRRAAVAALARIGDSRSVPALVQCLQDPELIVDAAGALARIGDPGAYAPLLPLLGHDRAAVRQAAIGALNSLGHPNTRIDIQHLLADPNPHVRESAVRIAGYFGYPECAVPLFARVHDVDENVRRAAVETLPYTEDHRVLPILLEASQDQSAKIRGAAMQSLAYIENAPTLPVLLRGLQDTDAWVRYYAARSLGQVRSTEAIDALAAIARNDSANHVRIAAAEALGVIGAPRVVSILAPLVDSEDSDLARSALMSLGAVGHPDALERVLTILRSKGPLRLDAVRAIALRRDYAAVEALQWTAAADNDPQVYEAAIGELSRMATPEATAALVRLTADRRLRELAVAQLGRVNPVHIEVIAAGLRSNHTEVRRAVIDALGRMKHPSASDALTQALDDEQVEVRTAAIKELKRLGNHTADRKLLFMAHSDPDPSVKMAAEQALEK